MKCCNSNENKKKIDIFDPLKVPEDQFICYCKEVAQGKIIQAIKNGAKTLKEIKEATGANTGNECKTKNPKGICCTGDINRLLDYWVPKIEAQKSGKKLTVSRTNIFRVGAVISAIFASACCWLPLLLIAVGVSAAGISAIVVKYRPIFIIIAFMLLGTAFYFTYRKKILVASDDCCKTDSRKAPGKFSKIMLWVIAVIVLGFLFFPNYVYLLVGKKETPSPNISPDMSLTTFAVEGMTCEACALGIEKEIGKILGVQKAEVSFHSKKAFVYYVPNSLELNEIAEAIERLGFSATILKRSKGGR